MDNENDWKDKPLARLACAMTNIVNILPGCYAATSTGTDGESAHVVFHATHGAPSPVCELAIDHPSAGNYLAAYIDHELLRGSTAIMFALQYVASEHELEWVEYMDDSEADCAACEMWPTTQLTCKHRTKDSPCLHTETPRWKETPEGIRILTQQAAEIRTYCKARAAAKAKEAPSE